MTDGRKDILIIMGRYLPGYKDGGPVRSIKNLTDFLGMKLQGYAKYDEDSERWSLLFAKTSTKNDRIYGDLKNIDSIDSSGIVYTSEGGKSRRVSLSHMKNIIVNGSAAYAR